MIADDMSVGRTSRLAAELMSPLCAVGGLLLLLFLGSGLRAEEEDAPVASEDIRSRMERWLGDLGSPDFEVREAARQGLQQCGASALDLLEARRDDPDPEVRRTVQLLLARLGHTETRPPALPGDLGALGRVTLKARGKAHVLLEALGRPHGASFEIPEESAQVEGEVEVTDAPFFAALDATAASCGLAAPDAFDVGGRMRLATPEEGEETPWAAVGPLRVRVAEVSSVRTLSPPRRRRYVVVVDLHWVPSVQVRTWRTPEDVEATDVEGRAFEAGSAVRTNVTHGISASARRTSVSLHLEPVDTGAADGTERLDTLFFTLPVCLRHDRREVLFAPLADLSLPATRVDAEGGTSPQDDVEEVTLRSVTPPDSDRGPWVVDLVARLSGRTARDSLQVMLVGADGATCAAGAGSRFPSADGTLSLKARAWCRWEEAPVAVRVTWYQREEEGKVSFTMRDVPLR